MAAEDQDASLDQVEEEFTVWKKNTPFLYDLIVSHPLEWPSLTAHWVPPLPQSYSADPTFAVHKLVLGTHTSEDVPNFLMIADAVLPTQDSESNVGGKNENPVIPKRAISNIEARLQGSVVGVGAAPSLPLAVERQARRLIAEAVSHKNLGKMYIWWMPWF